jgi:hypothetical protein
MKLLEIIGQWLSPTKILPAGTLLYHGTKTAGDFTLPDGPAWFAFSYGEAEKWINWSSTPPSGRTFGEPRVIVACVVKPVELADTRSLRNWQQFCQTLLGDPEPGIGVIAQAAKKARIPGWLGNTEVMLARPKMYLRPVTSPE